MLQVLVAMAVGTQHGGQCIPPWQLRYACKWHDSSMTLSVYCSYKYVCIVMNNTCVLLWTIRVYCRLLSKISGNNNWFQKHKMYGEYHLSYKRLLFTFFFCVTLYIKQIRNATNTMFGGLFILWDVCNNIVITTT